MAACKIEARSGNMVILYLPLMLFLLVGKHDDSGYRKSRGKFREAVKGG